MPGVRHLIWDQLPAAFRKLSKGLAAGSLKKSGWCWYSAAQSIGVPVVGLCEVTLKFWSRNGFPICNFNGSTIKTTVQEMLCNSLTQYTIKHMYGIWMCTRMQFQTKLNLPYQEFQPSYEPVIPTTNEPPPCGHCGAQYPDVAIREVI